MYFNQKPWVVSFLIFAGAGLVGCEGALEQGPAGTVLKGVPVMEPPVNPGTVPSAPVSTVPVVLMTSHIQFNNFTESALNKAKNAVLLIEKVLSSLEFKERVLNYNHNGMNQFYSTNDTNEEVYRTIIAAAESYNTEINHAVDLSLNIYTPSVFNQWGTVGYTYEDSDQIYTNVNYFNTYTAVDLAGHWSHEWTHKLGYGHDYNATSQRPYSVPYAVGDLVAELAAKL